jgi:3-oxoacid CoA-transferase
MNRACLGAIRSTSASARALTSSTCPVSRRCLPTSTHIKPTVGQARFYAQVGTPPKSHKVYDSAAEAVKGVKSGDIVLSGGEFVVPLRIRFFTEEVFRLQVSVCAVFPTL